MYVTPNLGLKVPEYADPADIGVVGAAFEALDQHIGAQDQSNEAQFEYLTSAVDGMKGQYVYIGSITTASVFVTQTMLTSYASGKGFTSLTTGLTIIDGGDQKPDDGTGSTDGTGLNAHDWRYDEAMAAWADLGASSAVAIATNASLGVVHGTADSMGVGINLDGTMKVNGLADALSGVTASLSSMVQIPLKYYLPITSIQLYVSTAGDDDTGDGSSEKPFKTVGYAVEEARKYVCFSVIEICIAPGTYPEKGVTASIGSADTLYIISTSGNAADTIIQQPSPNTRLLTVSQGKVHLENITLITPSGVAQTALSVYRGAKCAAVGCVFERVLDAGATGNIDGVHVMGYGAELLLRNCVFNSWGRAFITGEGGVVYEFDSTGTGNTIGHDIWLGGVVFSYGTKAEAKTEVRYTGSGKYFNS